MIINLISHEHNLFRVDNLFLKFKVFYGDLWNAPFKDNDDFLEFAKREWCDGLRRFSDDVFQDAITYCREYEINFPPTLSEFIGICRGFSRYKSIFESISMAEV